MFCSNCGRKCDDNIKFCPECGHSLGGGSNLKISVPNVFNNVQMPKGDLKKLGFLWLMIGSVVLSAISAFFPCILGELDYYFDSYTREFSMLEIFDLLEVIKEAGVSVGAYKFLFIVCIVISVIIGIAGIKMLYDMLNGGKGEKLTASATLASGFSVIRFLLLLLNVFLINKATSEKLWGTKFLSLSIWSWITVICAVICISVFSRFYLENCEKEEALNTRICKKCGTSFEIGEVCPKCGTKI